MKKSHLVIIVVLSFGLALVPALCAQELESPAAKYPSSVGVFGSSMMGGGLSYQLWRGPLGFAVTAGGSIQPLSYYDNTIGAQAISPYYSWNYNLELQGMYKLYSSDFWNWLSGDLFVYAMLGHKGGQSSNYAYDGNGKITGVTQGTYAPRFDLGAGIGYELTLFQHFSVPLEFGYTAEWPLQLQFTVAGGLRYRY